MRIQCQELGDFLQNLDEGGIHRKVVHVSRVLNKEDRRSPVTYVSLQCSAVVEYGDGTEALIECGFYCGADVATSDGGPEGSERFDEFREELSDYCLKKDLRLLPGVIDM